MTDEEALKLKPGDRIRVVKRRTTFTARVRSVDPGRLNDGTTWVSVRYCREGLTRYGNKRPVGSCDSSTAHALTVHDPGTANVFADWLEERGEYRAADLLREAFPMPLAEARSPDPCRR